MRIGFAGLGRMGAPMASNIAKRLPNAELTLWNRSADKAEALAKSLHCSVAASPKALSDESDIVITMLADDPSSEIVHLAEDGLFQGSARTFVEMGTMSPSHIDILVKSGPDGARIVDAPVSGATQAASDADLLIMAGCNEQDGQDLKPVLKALGRKTVFLGRSGAGAIMKLAVNSMIHGINQTLAEAMSLAEAAGIAPEDAFDTIEQSAACAPMLRYRRPLYLNEANHDVTFTVELALKDMEITATLADQLKSAMPQGHVTLDKLSAAQAQGYGERDMAAMLDYMRKERP